MSVTSDHWPAVGFEDDLWDVHPVTGEPRRRNTGRTYRACVPARIAELDLRLPGRVAAEAEDAAGAMRAFDTEVGHAGGPFASVMMWAESVASSRIEQVRASARDIAEAEVNGAGTGQAHLVVANIRATQTALDHAVDMDAETVLTVHETLLGRAAPAIAGRWRDDQVWIGGPGSPHDALFVPPLAGRVPAAVDDTVRFACRRDLPTLGQAAVAHAQFETVHPFPDGNGRTGRALIHSVLQRGGLTGHTVVPVSSGLLADTRGYYDALTAYRGGDVSQIVSTVSRAVLVGVEHGRGLIDDLTRLREGWDEELHDLRADAGARRLADALLRNPVVSAPKVRELLRIGKNEHRHIDALVERGVLQRHDDGKSRNVTWRAQDVLDTLDAHTGWTGRRWSM